MNVLKKIFVAAFVAISVWLYWPLTTFRFFDDEADNLAASRLITKGFILYRDTFSHHFPFPYYLFASFGWAIGGSITAARVCLLLFSLVTFLVIGVTTKRTTLNVLLGGVWTIAGTFMVSFMVVYHSIAAVCLYAVLALVLHTALHPSRLGGILLACYAVAAVLTDPLLVYPLAAVSLYILTYKSNFKQNVTSFITAVGLVFVLLSYLYATSSLSGFKEQSFDFNLNYYSKYRPAPGSMRPFLEVVYSLFKILDPTLWLSKSFFPSGYFNLVVPSAWDQSIFGGLLLRLLLLATLTEIAIKKQCKTACFLFVFFVLLAGTMHLEDMPGQSFFLCALFVIALHADRYRGKFAWIQYGYTGSLWIASAFFLITQRGAMQASPDLRNVTGQAQFLKLVSSPVPNASASVYPSGPYSNFMNAQPGIAGFTYFWPWVAEYGNEKTLAALDSAPAVLGLNLNGEIWGQQVKDFLRPITEYCEHNCFPVKYSVFVNRSFLLDENFKRNAAVLWSKKKLSVGLPREVTNQFFLPVFDTPRLDKKIDYAYDSRLRLVRFPSIELTTKPIYLRAVAHTMLHVGLKTECVVPPPETTIVRVMVNDKFAQNFTINAGSSSASFSPQSMTINNEDTVVALQVSSEIPPNCKVLLIAPHLTTDNNSGVGIPRTSFFDDPTALFQRS